MIRRKRGSVNRIWIYDVEWVLAGYFANFMTMNDVWYEKKMAIGFYKQSCVINPRINLFLNQASRFFQNSMVAKNLKNHKIIKSLINEENSL